MKRLWTIWLAAGIALLGGCDNTGKEARLTLSGSSTVAPLVLEIAKRFEKENPGTRIDVQTGGSGRGIADARSGIVDIGMASRALKDGERELFASPIAFDGIALIAHRSNPVQEMTGAEVASIYRGEITNWNALGGPDRAITLVHKAAGRATLELFIEHFGLASAEIQPDVVIGDNEQGIKTVAASPGAIGYVSVGTAVFNVSAGTPIKMLMIDGVAPSLAAVRAGALPIIRPLNLVTRMPPTGLAATFIEYARSGRVHDLIESLYFVPVDVDTPVS